jgi:hypothetical protein
MNKAISVGGWGKAVLIKLEFLIKYLENMKILATFPLLYFKMNHQLKDPHSTKLEQIMNTYIFGDCNLS